VIIGLLIAAVVFLAAGACVVLVRRGTRGPRSSRLLGRALNLAGRAPLARFATGLHSVLYQVTHGHLLSHWFGNPVLVIEMIGRRSGRPRAAPIIYLRQGNSWVVMPFNAGSDRTPNWWLNVKHAGAATVILDAHRIPVRPRIAEGEERDELWRQFVRQAPVMREYARLTTRNVPMVVLEPVLDVH
jgi:F420H(2)-dependent quinone reductase